MTSSPRPDPPLFEERFLRRAVELAHEGVAAGEGGPFGALVVRSGEVLAEGWNRVLTDNDPTAHAEVTAIRRACTAVGDFQLPGALYWVRPAAVFFAASRHDAAAADFDDSFIYDEIPLAPEARSLTFRHVPIDGATGPFAAWLAKTDRTPY